MLGQIFADVFNLVFDLIQLFGHASACGFGAQSFSYRCRQLGVGFGATVEKIPGGLGIFFELLLTLNNLDDNSPRLRCIFWFTYFLGKQNR